MQVLPLPRQTAVVSHAFKEKICFSNPIPQCYKTTLHISNVSKAEKQVPDPTKTRSMASESTAQNAGGVDFQ
jgi:hypothetical protein